MENPEKLRARIRQEARRGDWLDVANKLGKSPSLVHKVVSGSRQNDAVLEEFVKLLDLRAVVKQQFQLV